MKLLLESYGNETTPVIDNKNFYIEGVFLMGDRKNKNGRIYPSHVLDEAVAEYKVDYIDRKRAFGELDHPLSGAGVNLKNVSHVIESLTKNGSDYIGRAKILDNANGEVVKSLMKEGCLLSVSSRGLGAMRETSQGKIVDKFIIQTAADIVADPSGHACFVDSLMEGVEWIQNSEGEWAHKNIEKSMEIIEKVSRITATKEEREAAYLKVFEEFCQSLKS